MGQISFYLIDGATTKALCAYSCRYIEKAYYLGHRLVVLADSGCAQQLDHDLWRYKAESFIPHAWQQPTPVQITASCDSSHHGDVLLNLSQELVPPNSNFARQAIIVGNDPATLNQARRRYQSYKSYGCPLAFHDLRKESQHEH